ncbi:MAG: 4'-phosphopantetheinyl transferase superfamily protein, partial [Proteobacteria bacterium]|nr:4'-phosphopantetheinyl transferase superfamily protein [Pseudomonadota bacterium]
MIFGIGTDLVELSRVQGIYERFGERFAQRILTDEELELYRNANDPVRFLAM